MNALTSTLGYPRIGENRELKKGLEDYWSDKRSAEDLADTARAIRQKNWLTQKDAGIDLIASNDFSLYDHVLDTTCLVGAIPERFHHSHGKHVPLDTYFALARGSNNPEEICCATHNAIGGVVAQGLHKWFDTNYHYLVPEFRKDQQFTLSSLKPLREFNEAKELDLVTKPVLLGPVSYLLLGKCEGEQFDRLELLDRLLPVYGEVLQALSKSGAKWIQLDEPTLALDLSEDERRAFSRAYERLKADAGNSKLLLGTYFGELRENLEVALGLPVDAVHLDAVEAREETVKAIDRFPTEKTLSLGIVDGRNVWANNLSKSLELLTYAKETLGNDRLIIAPSSSLLHVPYDVEHEKGIQENVYSRLAFARQKLNELGVLKDALSGKESTSSAIAEDQFRRREEDTRTFFHPLLGYREEDLLTVPFRSPKLARRTAQNEHIHLPPLPTTTIGSFPQTKEIRSARARLAKGSLSQVDYDAFIRSEVAEVIAKQEEIGLDVLVHGEPERNDMTQFFAEQLDGIACTENGWVQSFGSRYVRPPIIHDQVQRTKPLTVDLATYAQSLTEKPVKGMLTGPLTIFHWSYPPEGIPASQVCSEIALAIRDEVKDLETAGIRIIQIDEPALREGLPLRKDMQQQYFDWATACFRLAASGASDATQIHTHTCYGDVRDILPVLKDLDVDVISIEAARSRLSFLDALQSVELPCSIGPGVWDIHSPRVPSTEELVALIKLARTFVPDADLWINPDCGLKTRKPEEVWQALKHLVEGTKIVRSSLPTNE